MPKEEKVKGFMKPLKPSEELAAVIGDKNRPRTKVVKKIWEYIKANDLQDKKDKRIINPDRALGKVLGKEPISMMKMAGKLKDHLSAVE